MSRLQRVQNQLWITVLISAIVQGVAHPAQGWVLVEFVVRLMVTAGIVYLLKWAGDTYEVRRRQ